MHSPLLPSNHLRHRLLDLFYPRGIGRLEMRRGRASIGWLGRLGVGTGSSAGRSVFFLVLYMVIYADFSRRWVHSTRRIYGPTQPRCTRYLFPSSSTRKTMQRICSRWCGISLPDKRLDPSRRMYTPWWTFAGPPKACGPCLFTYRIYRLSRDLSCRCLVQCGSSALWNM